MKSKQIYCMVTLCGTYLGQKKIVPVEKIFLRLIPKKYVLPTNQTPMGVEDTRKKIYIYL